MSDQPRLDRLRANADRVVGLLVQEDMRWAADEIERLQSAYRGCCARVYDKNTEIASLQADYRECCDELQRVGLLMADTETENKRLQAVVNATDLVDQYLTADGVRLLTREARVAIKTMRAALRALDGEVRS